jgi:hypothetical protein
VETDPVDSFFVTFENVLDFNLGTAIKLVGFRPGLLHTLLFEFVEVPDTNGLIEGTTCDKSVLRVESGSHHVVGVAREDSDAHAVLPIPNADKLVVGAGHDPGQVYVELYSSHVV